MNSASKHIIVVGGGTAGSVLAARLSEDPGLNITLLEIGADDDSYGDGILDPARAPEAWLGMQPVAMTPMLNGAGVIPMIQGRLLGGTSAVNGLATLRGLPEDYDGWAAMGLSGWGWDDVKDTFIAAETDKDFGSSPIHGGSGPLPVRRWRREEMGRAQLAFYDGMVELGARTVTDINDPSQLPGLGIFPVTIDDDAKRVTTSRAYLTPEVRARGNLSIRTQSEVATLLVDKKRVKGVVLATGEVIEGDEIVVSAGALWTPNLLMRSGIGPADHLADHGIAAHVDLPVGETMSDHIGPGLRYIHDGPRGGRAGPAQSLLIGASNGVDIDYHAFPIAPPLREGPTEFVMAVFLLRSSGLGSVRLAEKPGESPVVIAPPLPDDANERLRHAFKRIAAWETSAAANELGCSPIEPLDLNAPDAPANARERYTVSYGHMAGTCPMGTVLDADCRVLGIEGLRVADASVMPTIPSGNTYLGCVMVAERIARKMMAEVRG
ncbi:GMC family oxidoreductase [Hyphomonas sp.]|uniref:GMC family oxidoreductase n=1 Tax=Hyphomonas sp. TaxID=87 RepID=UPI0035290D18